MCETNRVNQKDYRAYMISLKDFVFKILPLYEEEVSTLPLYIKSISCEVYNVRQITSHYDGAWLVRMEAALNELAEECLLAENKKNIKNKVFFALDIIEKQIKKTEGE